MKSSWGNFILPKKEDKSIQDFYEVKRMKKINIKSNKEYEEDKNRDIKDYQPKQNGYIPDKK